MVPRRAPDPVRRLLPLSGRLELPELRHRLRRVGRKQVKTAAAGAIAAVIVEPMQGTAGNVIPPKEFLPAVRVDRRRARRAADRRRDDHRASGAPGKRWGVDHTGVRPDIVTIGKAFGGGFPLSGVLTTDAISAAQALGRTRRARRRATAATRWRPRPAPPRCGSSTRRSWSRTRASSARCMLRELEPFVDRYPFVGFVRGAGLFLAHGAGEGQEDQGAAAAAR